MFSKRKVVRDPADDPNSSQDPKHAELNPYLAAKREWLERYGDYIAQAKNWRITALLAMLVAVIAVIGLAISASQNKIVPYVVEVDKVGNVVAVGPADKASTGDQRVVKGYLERFITDFKYVTTDPIQQKKAIARVYSMLPQGSAALTKVSEYYKGHNPFELAADRTVDIDVGTVLALEGDKSWQVEWTETTRNLQGNIMGVPQRYKATMQMAVNPPTDEKQIRINPLGIFLPDLNWTQAL